MMRRIIHIVFVVCIALTSGVFAGVESGGNQTTKVRGVSDNIADYNKLKKQLSLEEASSAFTKNGKLKPEIIKSSEEIQNGLKMKNTKLVEELTQDGSRIQDWWKCSTKSINSPTNKFQVHFYKNRVTNKIYYSKDYKSVFNVRR